MPLETVRMEGVPVMATGGPFRGKGSPPEGDFFDEAKLARIAETTNRLQKAGELRSANKLGHDPEQRLLAQSGISDGERPAAGWLNNLRVKDGKLLADIENVPAKLAALIKAGAYRTRSAELRTVTSQTGQKVDSPVVTGLAWLGAQSPAIRTLDDVYAYYEDFLGDDDVMVVDYEEDDSWKPERGFRWVQAQITEAVEREFAAGGSHWRKQRRDHEGQWTEMGGGGPGAIAIRKGKMPSLFGGKKKGRFGSDDSGMDIDDATESLIARLRAGKKADAKGGYWGGREKAAKRMAPAVIEERKKQLTAEWKELKAKTSAINARDDINDAQASLARAPHVKRMAAIGNELAALREAEKPKGLSALKAGLKADSERRKTNKINTKAALAQDVPALKKELAAVNEKMNAIHRDTYGSNRENRLVPLRKEQQRLRNNIRLAAEAKKKKRFGLFVEDVGPDTALVVEYGDGEEIAWVVDFEIDDQDNVTVAPLAEWAVANERWVEAAQNFCECSEQGIGLAADTYPMPDFEITEELAVEFAEALGCEVDDLSPEAILEALKAEPNRNFSDVEFEELKANAEAGMAAARELHETKRDALLREAMEDGRIKTADQENWERRFEDNPELITEIIADLPKNEDTAREYGSDEPGSDELESEEKQFAEIAAYLGIPEPDRAGVTS